MFTVEELNHKVLGREEEQQLIAALGKERRHCLKMLKQDGWRRVKNKDRRKHEQLWEKGGCRLPQAAALQEVGCTTPVKDELVVRNLRLAVYWAKRFQGCGVDLEDLTAEATLGLMKAAELFDIKVQVRFSTYASWWVLQAINRAVVRCGRTVSLPDRVARLVRRLKKRCGDEAKDMGDVIKALGCTETVAERVLMGATQSCVSLNTPIGNNKDGDLTCVLVAVDKDSPQAEAERREELDCNTAAVKEALAYLPQREQRIIRLRYGIGGPVCTLKEVSLKEGICRERVRQIQDMALERMRRYLIPAEATV